MDVQEAEKVASAIITMSKLQHNYSHALQTILSRLGCSEADIDMYLMDSNRGTFVWINDVLPL